MSRSTDSAPAPAETESTSAETTASETDVGTSASGEANADATDAEAPLLAARNISKYYDQSEGFLDDLIGDARPVRAVDGVDLEVRRGETLAVVGESGCGKSTLGRTLLNLESVTGGHIEYRGEDITGLSGSAMQPYRRDLQMVFQDPLASLNPRQTVGEILKAPMEVHGIGESDEERTERVRELLGLVGLKEGHLDRYPRQFSGGQQQRVGVARALTLSPELIVADEPVSALDVSVQAQILDLLDDLQTELDLALCFVTHDLSVVRHVADRVAVMYLGEIIETAPVEELFANPRHPYTKSLLSAVPRIDPAARTDRTVLEGTVPSPADPPSGCRFHTRCPAVIPPAEWAGTQAEFKSAFTFRNRVLGEEIDPEAIRTRLSAESAATDNDAVATRITERFVPDTDAQLPANARKAIENAAARLANGETEAAKTTVTEAFPSPCEDETPRDTPTEGGHVACHRVDPEMPGDPDVL